MVRSVLTSVLLENICFQFRSFSDTSVFFRGQFLIVL